MEVESRAGGMAIARKQALGILGLVLIGAFWYAINGVIGVAIVVAAIILAVVILNNAQAKAAKQKEVKSES